MAEKKIVAGKGYRNWKEIEMSTREKAISDLNDKMPEGHRVSFEKYTADYKRFSKRPFKVYKAGKLVAHYNNLASIEARFVIRK